MGDLGPSRLRLGLHFAGPAFGSTVLAFGPSISQSIGQSAGLVSIYLTPLDRITLDRICDRNMLTRSTFGLDPHRTSIHKTPSIIWKVPMLVHIIALTPSIELDGVLWIEGGCGPD